MKTDTARTTQREPQCLIGYGIAPKFLHCFYVGFEVYEFYLFEKHLF